MRTSLCDLLSIDYPIIQAGMGPFTAAELVVAVCSAGALGSLGSSQRSPEQLREEMARIRERTDLRREFPCLGLQ
jgi:nitronate monooxygenase/enoyl-[acyl-carrier protein] reductase II